MMKRGSSTAFEQPRGSIGEPAPPDPDASNASPAKKRTPNKPLQQATAAYTPPITPRTPSRSTELAASTTPHTPAVTTIPILHTPPASGPRRILFPEATRPAQPPPSHGNLEIGDGRSNYTLPEDGLEISYSRKVHHHQTPSARIDQVPRTVAPPSPLRPLPAAGEARFRPANAQQSPSQPAPLDAASLSPSPNPRIPTRIPVEIQRPTYKIAFLEIIRFLEEKQWRYPRYDEKSGTMALAEPFTQGGLLVLLQEPPPQPQPWSKGIDAVISTCPTLEILRQGLQSVSKGGLSINTNVSVIDRWPFLPSKQHMVLQAEKPLVMAEFDRKVANAIRAKKPDVILCMGQYAKAFADNHLVDLASPTGKTVIIKTDHPSHSANHNRESSRPRQELYRIIGQAYTQLQDTQMERTRSIQDLLEKFAELCRDESCAGPTPCLSPPTPGQRPSYFVFPPQLLDKLNHMYGCLGGSQDNRCRMRAMLISTLMRLNAALTRTTYFPPGEYEVDWAEVHTVLKEAPSDLYSSFLQAGWWGGLAAGGETGAKPVAIMHWVVRMQNAIEGTLCTSRDAQAGVTTCSRCLHGAEFQCDDAKVLEAFRSAYVPASPPQPSVAQG